MKKKELRIDNRIDNRIFTGSKDGGGKFQPHFSNFEIRVYVHLIFSTYVDHEDKTNILYTSVQGIAKGLNVTKYKNKEIVNAIVELSSKGFLTIESTNGDKVIKPSTKLELILNKPTKGYTKLHQAITNVSWYNDNSTLPIYLQMKYMVEAEQLPTTRYIAILRGMSQHPVKLATKKLVADDVCYWETLGSFNNNGNWELGNGSY